MPIVDRKLPEEATSETTFSIPRGTYRTFVPQHELRHSDVIVDDPPDLMVADCAALYPQEWSGVGRFTFSALAIHRGLTPTQRHEDPVLSAATRAADTDALAGMALQMFPEMKVQEAVALVAKVSNPRLLQQLWETERRRARPREQVVQAFAAKGLHEVADGTSDAHADEDASDDDDGDDEE